MTTRLPRTRSRWVPTLENNQPNLDSVTITEFFDPSCEACRAFYPIVKQIMERHPGKVKLVLRYAAFHEGSDEAVKMLEAARLQDLFFPVLEALLARPPNGRCMAPLIWTFPGRSPAKRVSTSSALVRMS